MKHEHQRNWFAALFAQVAGRHCIETGRHRKFSQRHSGKGTDRRADKLDSGTPSWKWLRSYRKRLAGH